MAFVDDMEELMDKREPSGNSTAWKFLAMEWEIGVSAEGMRKQDFNWSLSSRKERVGRVVRKKSR